MTDAQRLATKYDVSVLAVELMLNVMRLSEAQTEYVIRTGVERGKIKTLADYELERLFGIHSK